MIGESPERFREEEDRLSGLFLKDTAQDIDKFFERNASPEYLQFLREEDERLDALNAQGIMV